MRGYIPESCHLHTHHLENLKYRISVITEPQITNCLRKCTRALEVPLDMKFQLSHYRYSDDEK
jgi:hypothetical protein